MFDVITNLSFYKAMPLVAHLAQRHGVEQKL